MNLFYAPDISGDTLILDREESRHLVKVLRKATGDMIRFTDGRGYYYSCRIEEANPKGCRLIVQNREKAAVTRNFRLTMAVAPTKNISRYEWFLEKATEIGVDRVIPFLSEHSERMVLKPERLVKVMIAAMKQSLKAFLPEITDTVTFGELVSMEIKGDRFIAHAGRGENNLLIKNYTPGHDAWILIGPEGDFSDAEVGKAVDSGFVPVSLGPSRLRTETAALAACHTVNLLNMR